MTPSNDGRNAGDPYDLRRFVDAQADAFERALTELQRGQKRTHWMWYIFPQLDGPGGLLGETGAPRQGVETRQRKSTQRGS